MAAPRRLVVMRHATAVSGAGMDDHERPLTAAGAEEAAAVARALVVAGWVPERALVSDAARTCETWWAMASVLGERPSVLAPSLYSAGLDALQAAVSRLEPDVSCVIAIGHNPGWSDAIGWLTGQQVRLAPAEAALLVGAGDRWADAIGYGALHVERVLRPRQG